VFWCFCAKRRKTANGTSTNSVGVTGAPPPPMAQPISPTTYSQTSTFNTGASLPIPQPISSQAPMPGPIYGAGIPAPMPQHVLPHASGPGSSFTSPGVTPSPAAEFVSHYQSVGYVSSGSGQSAQVSQTNGVHSSTGHPTTTTASHQAHPYSPSPIVPDAASSHPSMPYGDTPFATLAPSVAYDPYRQ
jgi:hypothetical protein